MERGDWATAAMELRWIAWDKEVLPGEPHPWHRPALPDLPTFSRLLGLARVTPLTIDGIPHELLAWDTAKGESQGWLCTPPPADAGDSAGARRGGAPDLAGWIETVAGQWLAAVAEA